MAFRAAGRYHSASLMNENSLKLGLVLTLLFVAGSALFWNSLYRSASAEPAASPGQGLLVLRHGGGAPLSPLPPRSPARVVRPPEPPAVPPPTHPEVEVRSGDSLARIAGRHLGNESRWPELARLNDIAPPYLIRPGQVLRLPAAAR